MVPILRKGASSIGMCIHDIAPTLLHMLGLPIPDYMDGRVLKEIFRKGTMPDVRPVKLQEYSKFTTGKSLRKLAPSRTNKEEIEKRLKGLGYL